MKTERFAIGIEDTNGGAAFGHIQIAEFSERFPVALGYWDRATYLRQWHEALSRLVRGASPIGLLTWMVPPDSFDHAKAWILYREGEQVFVQERLFVGPESQPAFDKDEQLVGIEPRTTASDDGAPISEWSISLTSIEDFLSNDRNV